MEDEKIAVRTEAGKTLEVVVVSKRADAIWVVLGAGLDNVKCKLMPTNNGLAYAGSVMGREIIYERGVREVKADIARDHQVLAQFRPGSSGKRQR
jgi:hypothetical protein